ncbi:MAG TPA: DUF2207 domain-containing protein [Pseudogracilibacillus sp.]|nr:DUF2207 domain-containing protein [Pseudogracilibacillus sp.]
MRKVLFGWILLMSLTFFYNFEQISVQAADNKIEQIQMEVFIHDDGSAKVKETRLVDLYEGTENYIAFGNLGNAFIENFKVSEDGRAYETVDNWNLDASREEKAFKSGIIETAEGIELSWGIGEYGQHEYILEYEITNFIKQLNDAQMLYWQFVNSNMDPPPENVSIEIEANENFTQENTSIWMFGHLGAIQLSNGKIMAATHTPMTSNSYVVILTKFKNGMFQADDVIDQSFTQVQNEAFVGSDYVVSDEMNEDVTDKKDAIVTTNQSQPEKPKQKQVEYDDDEEVNFGYYLKEIIAAISHFFKSLFA